jgi:hypothetical protein
MVRAMELGVSKSSKVDICLGVKPNCLIICVLKLSYINIDDDLLGNIIASANTIKQQTLNTMATKTIDAAATTTANTSQEEKLASVLKKYNLI